MVGTYLKPILDILQHVHSKVPDIDRSWNFTCSYCTLVNTYNFCYVIIFLVEISIWSSCLWLDHSDSEAFINSISSWITYASTPSAVDIEYGPIMRGVHWNTMDALYIGHHWYQQFCTL